MLKCHPTPFEGLWLGRKTFEIRREEDRAFALGDWLVLREWIAGQARHTGRAVLVRVLWVTRGAYGVPPDVAILGFDPCLRIRARYYDGPREDPSTGAIVVGMVRRQDATLPSAGTYVPVFTTLPVIEPRKDPT